MVLPVPLPASASDKVTLKIPRPLYERLQQLIVGTGFHSVTEFAVFVLLASLTVVAPVAYYLVAGERADATLQTMKTWLIRNNAAVISVLLLVFGVKLLAEGVQGLLG